jgi:hypothetical protein
MDDEAKKRSLANLKPFQPGKSGNPGGRSKVQIDIRDAARAHTREAIRTLVLVMRNGKPGEAAMAANSLLDRGYGRPPQGVAILDGSGNKSLRDLILASMSLSGDEDEPLTIEHESGVDNDNSPLDDDDC